MGLRRTLFSAVVFLSSACSLALEVVWTRQLSQVLGSAVVAVACVLAAFMAGLAIGARFGSWLARHSRRPLIAFAASQVLGAGAALLPQALIASGLIGGLASGLPLVVLATVPLGILFPLAGRVRETDGSGQGGRLGRLYALDTGGAVAGCLLTGALAIPWLGLSTSLLIITGAKAAVALACALLAATPAPTSASREATAPERRALPAALLLVVGIQGLAMLGAETLWSRLLAFVLYKGSSTYALTAMLVAVLASQSAGALWASRLVSAGRKPLTLIPPLALACSASIFVSLAILLLAGPVPSQGAVGPLDLLITLLACAPAGFFSGAIFAAACRTGNAAQTGTLLAINATGALLGALLIPLGLVPGVGLGWALACLGALPALAAAPLWPARRVAWALALVAAGCCLPLAGPAWARHLGPILFYHEGSDVSVAVVEDPPGVRRLYVDGTAVAGTDLALATDQKTLAHLPLLLHGHARRAMTIGFGSGGTSHSMLLHPGLAVDCVELSPAVLKAAPYLTEANAGLLSRGDPRYSLHLDDARHFLFESRAQWDVIVNDCTDLAFRSDAALYTREFFEQMRARLSPGGLAAVWIPLRGDPPYRSLRAVVGSFADVFPNASLWVVDALPVHFGILVGAEAPLQIDLDAMARTLRDTPVGADLALVGLDDPARLTASRQVDRAGLLRFAGRTLRHTDDRPVVEFWAAGEGGDDASAYAALEAIGPSAPPAVAWSTLGDRRRALARRLLVRPWILSGHRAYLGDQPDLARRHYLTALRLSPTDPALRTLLGIGPERESEMRDRLRQHPEDALVRASLGAMLLMRGQIDGAIAELDRAAKDTPGRPGILVALGLAQLEAGQRPQAVQALTRALALGTPAGLARKARLALAQAHLGRLPGWLLGRLTWPVL